MAEKICQVKSNLEEVELKENKGKEIPGTAKIIGNPKKASASLKKMSEVKERQVFKFGAEARKTVSDGDKSKKKSSKLFKCEQCDYECEKSCTLKKHMTSKHTEQKCSQDFKTIKDLVSHVAKEHHETKREWEVKNTAHQSQKSRKLILFCIQ